ncbi:MAG: hypothetical protein LBQ20_06635 [Rhodanobacter sp.]|jgi:hypothetical protein|nr:hypothetical protein [Rhodanobacter sp.]
MIATRFVLVSLLLLPALSAHALDIKGVRIGDTKSTVETQLGAMRWGLQCKPLSKDKRPADGAKDSECTIPVPVIKPNQPSDEELDDRVEIYRRNSRYAGESVKILYRFHHDTLAHIIVQGIPSSSYEDIEEQLEAKFGAPTSRENSSVKNHAGTQLTNTTARWTAGKQELTFERYGPDPAQTGFDIVDTDYRAAVDAGKGAAKRKGM